MLKVIKELLLKIVNDIDAGNSNLEEDEMEEIANTIRNVAYKDKKLSKYSACIYLGISRATFDNHVREGKLPKGIHEIGFKELAWYKRDLDKFIENNRL